jgi:CRISPR-associated protein Csd1
MLHQLIEFAQRENLKSEPGFKPKSVRWLILFTPDGRFIAPVIDLTGGDKKSKGREFSKCPELTFSELISGKLRHFLIDSLDKVALFTKEDATEKEIGDHNSFVSLLEKATGVLPSLSAIAVSLRDDAVLATIQNDLKERKAKPTDSATIGLLTGSTPEIFVELSDWHDWWREFRQLLADTKHLAVSTKSKAKAKRQMRCFLSGELVDPAPTQLKITGLSDVGGLPAGDVISSFDKESFGHFNFSQGENAAMSEEMVKTFTDALNHLIQRKSVRLAETKVVYWYSKPVSDEDDVIKDLFAGTELEDDNTEADSKIVTAPSMQEVASSESKARKLLESIRAGERTDLANCEFFAVTLSGNSGRVVIRDWMQGRFQDIAENIDAWFSDLTIVSRDGRAVLSRHKFAAVLASGVRDLKDVPSPTVASLWRCALQRQPIPNSLMAQTLQRVRIDIIQDQSARHARLGLLRAFCNRNPGVPSMNAEFDEAVDHPAYLSGRIMALLASIQEAALGKVGAGVVQRYYAAASATPALVLGRLVRTAQIAHLPKLEGGLQHFFESQMTETWGRLKSAPPTTLSLEEQTLFAMGYYHQQAARYKSKSKSDANSTDE